MTSRRVPRDVAARWPQDVTPARRARGRRRVECSGCSRDALEQLRPDQARRARTAATIATSDGDARTGTRRRRQTTRPRPRPSQPGQRLLDPGEPPRRSRPRRSGRPATERGTSSRAAARDAGRGTSRAPCWPDVRYQTRKAAGRARRGTGRTAASVASTSHSSRPRSPSRRRCRSVASEASRSAATSHARPTVASRSVTTSARQAEPDRATKPIWKRPVQVLEPATRRTARWSRRCSATEGPRALQQAVDERATTRMQQLTHELDTARTTPIPIVSTMSR